MKNYKLMTNSGVFQEMNLSEDMLSKVLLYAVLDLEVGQSTKWVSLAGIIYCVERTK